MGGDFLANYGSTDRWKLREHMGVEIDPLASKAKENVSNRGI